MKSKAKLTAAALTAVAMLLGACGGNANDEGAASELTKVKVMLDWVPNTNHTGLYVAQSKGYYEEEGLDVEIVQPGEGGTESLVATGEAEFGISVQENVTTARVQGVPVVSIGAIIQHNTSGFASLKEEGIESVKDFEGKVYGGWGSESEKAVIQSVMEAGGADYDKLTMLDSGYTDFFAAIQKDIDFGWIYYGWDGVQAELKNIELNMIYLNELSPQLDYYTPVLITNEKQIEERPEIVEAFMAATSKGYRFAVEQPEEAADALLAAVPDLDAELVQASQQWLADQYQADAPRWGEQKLDIWQGYADWMLEHGLLDSALDAEAAFTNEFLPES